MSRIVWKTIDWGTGPDDRRRCVGFYHAARNRFVICGGNHETWNDWHEDGDFWEWNNTPGSKSWWQNPTSKPSFGTRNEHAATYDSTRNKGLIFGGVGQEYWGDPYYTYSIPYVWEYNADGTITRRTPTGLTYWLSLNWPGWAYDPEHNICLWFGGYNTDSRFTPSGVKNWTYEYAPASAVFTPITGTLPPARCRMQMCYYPKIHKFVLYGGDTATGNSNALGDMWFYDPVTHTWAQQTIVGDNPGNRTMGKLVYDSDRNVLVLHQGATYLGIFDNATADSHIGKDYEFDGTTWTLKSWSGAHWNSGFVECAVGYDSTQKELLAFGGQWGSDGWVTEQLRSAVVETATVERVYSWYSYAYDPYTCTTGAGVQIAIPDDCQPDDMLIIYGYHIINGDGTSGYNLNTSSCGGTWTKLATPGEPPTPWAWPGYRNRAFAWACRAGTLTAGTNRHVHICSPLISAYTSWGYGIVSYRGADTNTANWSIITNVQGGNPNPLIITNTGFTTPSDRGARVLGLWGESWCVDNNWVRPDPGWELIGFASQCYYSAGSGAIDKYFPKNTATGRVAFTGGQGGNPFKGIAIMIPQEVQTPPILSNLDPAEDETGVLPNSDISLDITEAKHDIDEASVILEVNNVEAWKNGAAQPGFSVTKTRITKGYRYLINPSSNFWWGSTVRVDVFAKDLAPYEASELDTSYTFDIAYQPGISAIGHQLEVGPLIGSGVLTYRSPLPPAETDSIGLRSKYTELAHPRTLKTIEGWKWDNRIWTGYEFENYAAQLPCNWDPTISDIPEDYFQSGIGSHRDLELVSIQSVPSSGLNAQGIDHVWAPEINHGYYYDFATQSYLFSDDSEVLSIAHDQVVPGLALEEDLNYVNLSARPKVGVPVLVEQYQWDNGAGEYLVTKSIQRKPQLTGRLEDGVRLETYSAPKEAILWDNIDQDVDEFTVTFSGANPRLILNKQYVEEVGVGGSGLDILGYADGRGGQQFHTTYSPVDDTMDVLIYSYMTTSGIRTTWDTIPFSGVFSMDPSDFQVRFDPDLGLLEFGMNGENNIPAAGATIAARYWKGMRVEYEPDYTTDTVVATEASLNPIYRRGGKGFVFLRTTTEDPASIELKALLARVQENVYGPVYIGNTVAPIVATVKDVYNQPLDGQPVTFYITTDPPAGSFGGEDLIISPTNQIGEAKVFYNPPRGVGDIGENVEYPWVLVIDDPGNDENWRQYGAYSQITVLRTKQLVIEGDAKDLFVYQVHIDDPLLGYLGDLEDPYTMAAQLQAYYDQFFSEEGIYGPTGAGPHVDRDAAAAAREWEDTHRMLWELSRPRIFQSNKGMGRRRICAILDSNALNPHTFELGALVPVQPVDVRNIGEGKYDVVFDTSVYSMPLPTASKPGDPSGTLHSYFVVAPTTVTLRASVFNRRLNQEIMSNAITLKLRIPPYLSGLWLLDSINQAYEQVWGFLEAGLTASGQKIPLGFRLRSDGVTLAGALDGVTFLDVNPEYEPALGHQINVIVPGDDGDDV